MTQGKEASPVFWAGSQRHLGYQICLLADCPAT